MHTLLLLFLLTATPPDSAVKSIREKYTFINQHIKTYKHKEQEYDHNQGEPSQLDAWFAKDTVKLIAHTAYHESGRGRIEYYYENNQIIFIYKRLLRYNIPYYEKEWDLKKSTVNEERYYFKNNQLIQAVKGKELIQASELPGLSADLLEEEQEMRMEFK